MKVAICDKDLLFVQQLREMLEGFTFISTIRTYSDFDIVLAELSSPLDVDVVLMGIDWGTNQNGLYLAEELYRANPSIRLVYVTGCSDSYVQQVFLRNTNLKGIVKKPVDSAILEALLCKFKTEIEQESKEMFTLKRHNSIRRIRFIDILYLESNDHSVDIQTVRERLPVYKLLSLLKEEMSSDFVQCHKSYIVNMQHIRKFSSKELLLEDGTRLPVGKTYYEGARNAYYTFIGKSL